MNSKLPSFKEYHNDPEVIEEILPALAAVPMALGKGAMVAGRVGAAAAKGALPVVKAGARGLAAAGKAALPVARNIGNAVSGTAKAAGNALSTVADVASMGSSVADIAKQQVASTAPGVPAEGVAKAVDQDAKAGAGAKVPQNIVKKMIPNMVDQAVASAGPENEKVVQQELKKAAQNIGKAPKPAGQL